MARRILPAGQAGLLVEVDDLAEVLALHAALRTAWAPPAARPPGVVDIVPAARTILLVTEPGAADLSALAREVAELPVAGGTGDEPDAGSAGDGPVVSLPVRYDGPDLGEVATALGCGPDEVARRHAAQLWAVAFCGFAPGFGYLVPAGDGSAGPGWQWQVPRRAQPRTRVPTGAVGLAGPFSGVYPRESPGGWQLIGHTPVAVFDPDRDPPALLRPGTRVRFVPEDTAP
jgi:KipI family sensor histidine kinase inhibitor